MTLTLEITAPSVGKPGDPISRQTFGEEGGSIGRAPGRSWVLSHNMVSKEHALISFRNGVFYIQDRSTNGVAVNSPDHKLARDRPYALKPGDRIFIEPYTIEVSIDDGSGVRSPSLDPFRLDDPFAPLPAPLSVPDLLGPGPEIQAGEVDPLKFFEPLAKPAAPRKPEPAIPPGDELLSSHYEPPRVADPVGIPQGYDPMAPDDPFAAASSMPPSMQNLTPPPRARDASGAVPLRPRPGELAGPRARDWVAPEAPPPAPARPPLSAMPLSPPSEQQRPDPSPSSPEALVPPPAPVEARPPAPAPVPPPAPPSQQDSNAFADMLAGAGLEGAVITPELMRNFGQILRVVVSGLMDVLQARQRIKEEFRMRQTTFRPADNNPLKFSANVEDALHNLLVKRNTAYLGPVDAFADAFEDLRNHQLAMLAGLRVAFEGMMNEFDPDRLQEEFDRQLTMNKGALDLMPAKLRYWDLFRERRRDMVKDPDATFTQLFGEEFARAYEEQFRRLKAERRGGDRSVGPMPPPRK